MEDEKQKLRDLTVEVVLALRAAYLRTSGANVLKHWDTLLTRLRSAARTCATPEELVTQMQRRLGIQSLNSDACRVSTDLADYVREHDAATRWLDMLDREHGFVMAQARLVAERRKEERCTK